MHEPTPHPSHPSHPPHPPHPPHPAPPPATTQDVARLAEMIRGIDIAMLTTVAPDGTLRSRPMATQHAPFDGELWFFADVGSGKVDEIARQHHVNLAYADPRAQRYVSVCGTATILRDAARARSLWTPVAAAWFPGGPEDPSLALLRVRVTEAEYWDSPSGAVVRLVGFLRGVVTGERPEPPAHGHVAFHERPAR